MGTQYQLMTLFADGGWMMFPLILCSLIALGVIIAKFWTLMVAHHGTANLLAAVEEATEQGDLEGAFEIGVAGADVSHEGLFARGPEILEGGVDAVAHAARGIEESGPGGKDDWWTRRDLRGQSCRHACAPDQGLPF